MRPPQPTRYQLLIRKRYVYLREHGRCVGCTKNLPPERRARARCAECSAANNAPRNARAAANPQKTGPKGPTGPRRCKRCGLRGRHECLPAIDPHARSGVGRAYPEAGGWWR